MLLTDPPRANCELEDCKCVELPSGGVTTRRLYYQWDRPGYTGSIDNKYLQKALSSTGNQCQFSIVEEGMDYVFFLLVEIYLLLEEI